VFAKKELGSSSSSPNKDTGLRSFNSARSFVSEATVNWDEKGSSCSESASIKTDEVTDLDMDSEMKSETTESSPRKEGFSFKNFFSKKKDTNSPKSISQPEVKSISGGKIDGDYEEDFYISDISDSEIDVKNLKPLKGSSINPSDIAAVDDDDSISDI
jgi:hypothetical protein